MDEKIFEIISDEERRQSEGLELIPSENYVSLQVLKAMGSVLTNKYSEGYPNFEGLDGSDAKALKETTAENHRYYGGQENTDRIERLAISRARRLFHADHANVQPHSGAQANNAVYNAWLKPGDTVLGMDLGHGGHLTHGAPVTQSAKIYNFIGYGTNTETGDLDYDEIERLALEHKPKILLVGYSAFMKIPDFDRIAAIGAKIPGCLLMADMAHVAGLIAGGFSEPLLVQRVQHAAVSAVLQVGVELLPQRIALLTIREEEGVIRRFEISIDQDIGVAGAQMCPDDRLIVRCTVDLACQQRLVDLVSCLVNLQLRLGQCAPHGLGENIAVRRSDGHRALIEIRQSLGDKSGLLLPAAGRCQYTGQQQNCRCHDSD